MAAEKNNIPLTQFFFALFHNLPKLLLTNLLFAVPFAVFFGIFYLINKVTALGSNFILFLSVIPLFPFYAGVIQVTSHMARGEEDVDVLHNFFYGIKDNLLRFLIHGVVFYAAIVFSYYSINMYLNLGKSNGMFYVFFVISIIIAVIFLFAFFYIPSMTVTFDLSMKNIYKNSMLMTFGELKHNLFAVLGLFVLFLISATALVCCGNAVALIVVTVILALFILPSIAAFIINSAVYERMYNMIVNGKKKADEINKKIENRKNGQFFDDEDKKTVVPEDFDDIEIDASKDGDEYIFYNGKMVKRSVLLRQKEQAQKKEND